MEGSSLCRQRGEGLKARLVVGSSSKHGRKGNAGCFAAGVEGCCGEPGVGLLVASFTRGGRVEVEAGAEVNKVEFLFKVPELFGIQIEDPEHLGIEVRLGRGQKD